MKDLKSAHPIAKHKESPYPVEFKNKEAVKRLLAAPQATKYKYCGPLGLANRGKNSGGYVSQKSWMEKGHPMGFFL